MATRQPFMCVYTGPRNECSECTGYDPTGTGFCSHECGEARARREHAQDAELQARRAREDAFAREVERLHAEGYSYREIDALLAHMPT